MKKINLKMYFYGFMSVLFLSIFLTVLYKLIIFLPKLIQYIEITVPKMSIEQVHIFLVLSIIALFYGCSIVLVHTLNLSSKLFKLFIKEFKNNEVKK
jgi:hypothetical protein